MSATDKKQKQAVIAGAGPAGLTGAYELLKHTDIHPVVFEESGEIGGISRTVRYHGNRMDIGGHRFFSKSQRVTDWWDEIMPLQGAPSLDDKLLHTTDKTFAANGPDPEQCDRVMLVRNRISRIFYLHKFFDYPISLKLQTFTNMGLVRTIEAGCGYLWSVFFKKPETSLENFYINRFGKPLYRMFFEDYTEKVWGVHPSKLGADWGAQRVKGLSIFAILKDMLKKSFSKKENIKEVETSLIEQFVYPKLGPGQLWEPVADEVPQRGGEGITETPVKEIHVENNRVTSVTVENAQGERREVPCDYLLSSLPLKDLVQSIRGIEVPDEVKRIAGDLPYRDFITVGLLMKHLTIDNQTRIKTFANRIPDTWIYIQERDVRIGRLQVFNNWSPYLVKDYENTMWIGLEYFCTEGDAFWQMDDREFIDMAVGELAKIGIIDPADVLDSVRIKVKKAYPSYFGSYYELDRVKEFLNGIENLWCIGRNGQHRYNNMDHSMMTAMVAVDHIAAGNTDKSAVWSVNTEEEYHESK